jgi:hypothetical protein
VDTRCNKRHNEYLVSNSRKGIIYLPQREEGLARVDVEEFFQKFLRLNGDFKKPEGKVFLREFDRGTFEFGLRGKFSNLPNLKLGILNLRNAPRYLDKEDMTRNLYFLRFIQCLSLQLNLGLHDPPVWIWITKTSERHAQVIHYVEAI